jgi:2-polyprenyl-3-methyl-5-hydroxy-6-metoxy-1,4-benzoquinol methylase
MSSGNTLAASRCRVCASETTTVGTVTGKFSKQAYELRHCHHCQFSFISNPWTDYAKIYDQAYYHGKGSDPLLDYVFELDSPDITVRKYEWRGILDVVKTLVPDLNENTRWLDFGCGNGGLVRYAIEQTQCRAFGFDEGWIRDRAVERGIPYISAKDFDSLRGSFDVITAIEVLEHVADPVGCLKTIRSLLKEGGVFFLTTGNAKPFRNRLVEWKYVVPEIHISFYEPETLETALKMTGFSTKRCGFVNGFCDIIRYKVLKNLGFRKCSLIEKLLPWQLLTRIVDSKYAVSAQPVAYAIAPK